MFFSGGVVVSLKIHVVTIFWCRLEHQNVMSKWVSKEKNCTACKNVIELLMLNGRVLEMNLNILMIFNKYCVNTDSYFYE